MKCLGLWCRWYRGVRSSILVSKKCLGEFSEMPASGYLDHPAVTIKCMSSSWLTTLTFAPWSRTMRRTGVAGICVVTALEKMKEATERRFGRGPEAHLPLFRWSSGQAIKRLEVQNILHGRDRIGRWGSRRSVSNHIAFELEAHLRCIRRQERWKWSSARGGGHQGRFTAICTTVGMWSKAWQSTWPRSTSMSTTPRPTTSLWREGGWRQSHDGAWVDPTKALSAKAWVATVGTFLKCDFWALGDSGWISCRGGRAQTENIFQGNGFYAHMAAD